MLATQHFVANGGGDRRFGADRVLHRQGGRAAVAVSVGVAGGVPNDQSREAALSVAELSLQLAAFAEFRCVGTSTSVELGVHLPLMELRDEGQSLGRLQAAVDAAAQSGFVAVSANDHFVFSTPWLDGPTALAAVIDRSGEMTLATTIALAALRGPVRWRRRSWRWTSCPAGG